ncbi:LysR family transcriptional regulator [Pseudomonas batumici]|uniref:LysR family transcriptional regulator n=1 Tax=Pseudomonas batumici TaxID=226910 RepID=UPI003BAF891E
MDQSMSWELYRTLLAVLTEGSLSGAARALGIAQPTVGRHIAALEASFKQPLFTRSQTGLLPTETALALRGYAEAMQHTAAALERAATGQGQAVSGTVRISASEIIAVEVLPPTLALLHQAHPQLRIELLATDKVQDLLQREADIAVRMTAPKQDQLLARRIGNVEVGAYAHADYLQRNGTPATLADLSRHALIGFDVPTPFLRAASKQLPGWNREAFALRTDSNLAQLAMIRAGCGIGFCQVALASRTPTLVRLLPQQLGFQLETWVTMHEDLRTSPRCRATFDALVECLQAHTRVTRQE